ncbi:MAG: ABC transporter substrate-binding protein [Gemmatimonadota bacterium]|nr:MAG: ABC transporter substrate-binding protein [Gemmatimonadota bacterium]
MPRVASLFPAATEIVFAVGAGDQLVGVSHECDHPPEARERKRVTHGRFDPKELSSSEIYRQKVETSRRFGSVYRLDETAMWGLRADVIITQGPSDFSLVSLPGIRAIADGLNPRPELITLYPRHMDDVLEDHIRVGLAVGRLNEAHEFVDGMNRRMSAVQRALRTARRVRVAFIQWLDPCFSGGYWIPQLIEVAGGVDALNTAGLAPGPVAWSDLRRRDPEAIVVACEDLGIERIKREMRVLSERPGWKELSAVRFQRVYLGDGAAFTRAGPRLIDAIEILAWALHPNLVDKPASHELLRTYGY